MVLKTFYTVSSALILKWKFISCCFNCGEMLNALVKRTIEKNNKKYSALTAENKIT